MARGVLYVETWPSAPGREAEYHKWYDEVHLPEVVALDGFVSGRRLAPVDGEGPFVALYEIEADDVPAVAGRMLEAAERGELHMSDALRTDPGPVMRLLEVTTTYDPAEETGR